MAIALIGFPVACCSASDETGFSVGIRAGYYLLPNWSDTYDIIYDNGGEMTMGIEIGYRFSERIEAGIAYDMVSGDGERVWPDESGGWQRTGESVSFDLLPLTVFGRYTFIPESTLSPYIGLAVGYCTFKETDDESTEGFGAAGSFGVKWKRLEPLEILAEVEYATYPDVIGEGDLSGYFSEDDVGGLSARIGLRYNF